MNLLFATESTVDTSLATWNRQRTSEELRSFIRSHAANLPDDTEIE
jgi:hypothetical protein